MKPHFQLFLWLGFVLVGCDKPEKPGGAEAGNGSRPVITKNERDTPTERKSRLRRELDTAGKVELPELRAKAIAEVAWNAIELDPEVALAALQQLGIDNPERIRLIQHHAMRMAEQNPDAALEWAASLGSETETAAAKGSIALVMAENDPERAANLLSESGIAGREFDVAVVQVLQRWAQKAPADAAAWVAMFPAGPSREAGIKAVVSSWADSDAKALFSWTTALKDETVRGEVEKALEDALMDQPEDVRNASLLHADPPMRDRIRRREEMDR